jgi:hypothetical protein
MKVRAENDLKRKDNKPFIEKRKSLFPFIILSPFLSFPNKPFVLLPFWAVFRSGSIMALLPLSFLSLPSLLPLVLPLLPLS